MDIGGITREGDWLTCFVDLRTDHSYNLIGWVPSEKPNKDKSLKESSSRSVVMVAETKETKEHHTAP